MGKDCKKCKKDKCKCLKTYTKVYHKKKVVKYKPKVTWKKKEHSDAWSSCKSSNYSGKLDLSCSGKGW